MNDCEHLIEEERAQQQAQDGSSDESGSKKRRPSKNATSGIPTAPRSPGQSRLPPQSVMTCLDELSDLLKENGGSLPIETQLPPYKKEEWITLQKNLEL